MTFNNLFLLLFFLFIIVSCSSSYEYLSKNSFDPPNDFSKYLIIEYKNKANFEARKMHDWNSAKLYSKKALEASNGVNIKPEIISFWKITETHKFQLEKAYDNLMKVYEDAIKLKPYDLAIAISSLDCWAEQQEEGWQTWDINICRNDYINSMHNIYNEINNNNKKDLTKKTIEENSKKIGRSEDSVIVITKNINKEVKQIIYFDFDKTNINNVSFEKIKGFMDKNQDNINKYLIVGHTDTKGTNDYNLKLSLNRAKKIQNILIKIGIKKNNTKIVAMGESDLAIQTGDGIAHPANRRAEISKIN